MSKYGYVVCFGVSWLADWKSKRDVPRTLVLENARVYTEKKQAQLALRRAISKYPNRNYSGAKVQKISIKYKVTKDEL